MRHFWWLIKPKFVTNFFCVYLKLLMPKIYQTAAFFVLITLSRLILWATLVFLQNMGLKCVVSSKYYQTVSQNLVLTCCVRSVSVWSFVFVWCDAAVGGHEIRGRGQRENACIVSQILVGSWAALMIHVTIRYIRLMLLFYDITDSF